MSTYDSLIVSDAHLGAAPAAGEQAFHDFLVFAGGATRDLVINGDLFDYWFEYRTVVLSRHFRTLRVLADLVDAGVRVRLVGGNHDSWGGAFLADEIGLELIDGPVTTEIGGRICFLAHGDGLGSGDLGYRVLKRVIRSRAARATFRHVHPDWADALAGRVSRTRSRHGTEGPGESRSGELEAHARRTLQADPSIQLVAYGHCHVPSLIEVEPGRHYLNTGDWIRHCTWGSVGRDEVRLHRWHGRD
ncbi:MAG: UDP-2,3-diacylglucosamine diphosphatase [Gemmatimonadota bacterium]|nr:UDP-2,3-diacylglucosamine diphosphatase [Gemmatimonadota bacterium]MDH3427949.1 UDP-2,3-diacylglucosamine diphosphatase [Gemmatimonadota bacterium]